MEMSESRRARRQKKRTLRTRRRWVAFVAAVASGSLIFGTASMAMATEAPADESTAPAVLVEETTAAEEVVAEEAVSPDTTTEAPAEPSQPAPEPVTPASQPIITPEATSEVTPVVEPEPEVAPATQQVVTQTAKTTQAKPNNPVNYGTIGALQPSSSDANKASYWVTRIPNAVDCYKYEGRGMQDNAHAYLTNGGKTVVLKPYGTDWPGDHWAALIVKASTWDAVTLKPTAGTNYAAYDNKDISHYIVCKGKTPQQPKPKVTITGAEKCVAGFYSVTWTVTITNYGSLNEVDLKAISHSPSGSLINGVNGQVWFYEWLEHSANHGLPAFPPGGTFTFTQSNIPGTATAASVTIQYDFKNGPSGDPVGIVTLGGDCAPPPPTDVCKNIGGNQETVPDGYIGVGDKCYLIKERTEKGKWTEQAADCEAGIVTSTRTVWTVKYYVKHGKQVEISRTESTDTKSRPLNDKEIEDCKPDTPDPKVTYTEWVDEEWVCGDDNVTQTRTKTTTPWKWVYLGEGKFELQPDTANAVTVPETHVRDLKPEEIESCKPETPEPAVGYSDWIDGEWVCGDTTVTQTRTVTTTPFIVVNVGGSSWAIVEDTDNITTEVETQVRQLTNEEISTCPLGLGDVTSRCVGDVPYFSWSGLALPEGFVPEEGATMSVTFVHPSDSSQNYTVSGLTIAEDGSFLWPGATDGEVKNWPGWVRNTDGSYSETDGNFRWTRAAGGITVLFQVNPELSTTVIYPNESALCANPPVSEPPVEEPPTKEPPTSNPPAAKPPVTTSLPATGGSLSWGAVALMTLFLGAGAGAIVWDRRRRVV